jgi:hypothetical protein
MAGLLGQGCQHKTARIRQSGQSRKKRTARKDRQNRIARTARAGQSVWDRHDRTGATRMHLQGYKEKITRAGLSALEC